MDWHVAQSLRKRRFGLPYCFCIGRNLDGIEWIGNRTFLEEGGGSPAIIFYRHVAVFWYPHNRFAKPFRNQKAN